MKNKPCPLYTFMAATKGNWRNSIYIKCSNTTCPYDRTCSGFLLTFDSEARPVIVSAETIRTFSEVDVDPTECITSIKRADFEMLFSKWLEWETNPSDGCVLDKLGCMPNCAQD